MEKKIRVLNVISTAGVGGLEKFVLSLCRYHDKSRFEVVVGVLLSDDIMSKQIAREGYDVEILGMKNGFDFIRAIKLPAIIRRRKIDIVNIHANTPLALFFSILSSAPVVINTDHGTTISSPVKRKRRVVLFNRLMVPFIDCFIAVSNGMVRSLRLREKVPEAKIKQIYNGVDVERISNVSGDKEKLKNALGIQDGTPVLGTIGRLVPEKQYPLLFKSLSVLKEQGINFVALVIGDGPDRASLEFLANEMSLNNHVRFLGQRDDVFELLDLMDVFVFSSGGEAFSIVLLEVMAKATPIVAFDVEGVNEAVVHGQTGFLIPFGDTDAFAKGIIRLFESPELAEKMGIQGYKRVNNMFNLKSCIRELEKAYENFTKNN